MTSVENLFTIFFPIFIGYMLVWTIPVAARSKAWAFGRSPAENMSANPTGQNECLSVVSVVCCQVEVCATG